MAMLTTLPFLIFWIENYSLVKRFLKINQGNGMVFWKFWYTIWDSLSIFKMIIFATVRILEGIRWNLFTLSPKTVMDSRQVIASKHREKRVLKAMNK